MDDKDTRREVGSAISDEDFFIGVRWLSGVQSCFFKMAPMI
jgi:hypothetical protein